MKKMFTDNLWLKILSVLMAILIWIVVLNINDPSKTRTIAGVRVELLNEDIITGNNQVYDILDGQLVSITVTGPRTIVDTLKAKDFTVTADFKDLSQANSIPINVELAEYSYQQKVTINKKSHNTVQLLIEDLEEKEYDIDVRYIGQPEEGYIIANTVLDTPTVKITAPVSVHQNIKQVCVSVDASNASADFETVVPVKVYDSKAVELIQAENNVAVNVTNISAKNTVYYTKKIPIVYDDIENAVNGLEVSNVEVSMREVSVMGRKEVLDMVERLRLPTDTITFEDGNTETKVEYNLQELLPEGVYLNEKSDTLKLTVYLTEIIQRTLTINITDIGIRNIPDGMGASIVDSGTVRVLIQGKKHAVEELDAGTVSAYVSVRGGNAAISSVPVQLQLPEGITQVENVYVRVSLTNTEPEPTRETQTQKETSEPDTTTPTVNIPEPTTTTSNPTTPPHEPEDDTTTMPEDSSQTQET